MVLRDLIKPTYVHIYFWNLTELARTIKIFLEKVCLFKSYFSIIYKLKKL